MRFVDSHLHLDSPDATRLLEYAKSASALLVGCGTDRVTSGDLYQMKSSFPDNLACFVGVHPSEVGKESDLSWVEGLCKQADGIGEIGLDPTYSPSSGMDRQMVAFRAQLGVAERHGKPVEVHSRQAEKECVDALSTFRVPRVLMHWLESEGALPGVMGRGYYVSFGPALLYSKKLQMVASKADPSLMLLESDSPVAYGPLGGARGPFLIPSVAFMLSGLLGRGFEDTLDECNRNALRFLGR